MVLGNRVVILLALLLTGAAFLSGASNAADEPFDLAKAKPASKQSLEQRTADIAISGRIYGGYIHSSCTELSFGTWRVPSGFGAFEAYCGIDDECSGEVCSATFNVLLDGNLEKTVTASKGDRASFISIPVTGGQSLRLEIRNSKRLCGRIGVIAAPRLLKVASTTSTATDKYKCSVCGRTFDLVGDRDTHARTEHGGPVAPNATSTFVVDPKDITALAVRIADQVRSQLQNGKMQVAVAKFKLISDGLRPSVSEEVLEDLSTALIETKAFKLVERSQLNTAMEELKLNQSGIIDSATAQKLGKMVGAKAVLIGSISDRGRFGVINVRLLNTETGEAEIAANVETRK